MQELLNVQPLDEAAVLAAKKRWDAVAKPLHGLGRLEDMIARIAGIQGSDEAALAPRCALVFCSDNGVVAQGVSQSESVVTQLVARSIAEGEANVNLMAAVSGTDVLAVDIGMNEEIDHPAILVRKAARGTGDISLGPAMTRAQAEETVRAGMALVGEMKARGYRMIATGEMGIGNTTTATAVACAMLGCAPERIAGRGAGLSDAGLARKVAVIERALEVNRPDARDALDVLAKVGGYDIAGMTGAFLGGAVHRVPVVIDGAISAVAALLAVSLCPTARAYMLPSHVSREPAAGLIMERLGLMPVVHADMALGEGTGAVALFPLLDMAANVYRGTHTFGRLGMDAYTPQGGGA